MIFTKYQKLVRCFIMIGVIVLAAITIFAGSRKLVSIAMLVILVIMLITLRIIKKKQSIKAMEMLNIYLCNCDPALFIKKVMPIAYSTWTYKNIKYYWQLWIVNALYDLGKVSEAYKVLENLQVDNIDDLLPNGKLIYMVNKLHYFLVHNELFKAEKIYIDICDSSKLKDDREVVRLVQFCEAEIDYYKENYDKCYDYFLSVFNNCEINMRQKVLTAYRLGVICSNMKIENAEKFYAFVVANGNKMNVVKMAEEEMGRLTAMQRSTGR